MEKKRKPEHKRRYQDEYAQRTDHVKTKREDKHLQANEKGLQNEINTADTMISDLWSPELCDKIKAWVKSLRLQYFLTAVTAN